MNKKESIENSKNKISYFNHLYFNDLSMRMASEEEEISELFENTINSKKKGKDLDSMIISKEFDSKKGRYCNLFSCLSK